MKKLLFTFISIVFFIPLTASASFHNFTCAELTTAGNYYYSGGGSCTGSTFTNDGTYSQISDHGNSGTFVYPLTNGATYYITFIYSGSGNIRYVPQYSGNPGTYHTLTSSALEVSFVNDSGSTAGVSLDTPATSLTGTISGICIDNDGVSCSPAVATNSILSLVRSFWLW